MKKILPLLALTSFFATAGGSVSNDIVIENTVKKIKKAPDIEETVDLATDSMDWYLFYGGKSFTGSNDYISAPYLINGAVNVNLCATASDCKDTYISPYNFTFIDENGEYASSFANVKAEQTSMGLEHYLKSEGDGFGFDVKIPVSGRYMVTLFHHAWMSSSKMEVCTESQCKKQFLKQIIAGGRYFAVNKVKAEITTTGDNETVTFSFKRQSRHYDYKGTNWQVLESVKLEKIQ